MPFSQVATIDGSPTRVSLASCFSIDETEACKTLLVKTPQLTMLYLSMAPGQGMPVHDHPGCTVAIQGMVGEATVLLDGKTHRLAPGELLSFAGECQVSPRNESPADAAVMITLANGG